MLLTGGSEGIGKEMTLQLCQQGARVVIVARTESKLAKVSAECEAIAAAAGKGSKAASGSV